MVGQTIECQTAHPLVLLALRIGDFSRSYFYFWDGINMPHLEKMNLCMRSKHYLRFMEFMVYRLCFHCVFFKNFEKLEW